MAWLAVLKHAAMVYDFAAEVLRDKLSAHDPVLRPSDYEAFVHQKSPAHPELIQLTASSKNKIRQVLLRMLLEAGILKEGSALGLIQRPVLPPGQFRVIASDSPHWLAGFLVPDTEISQYSDT